MIINKQASFFPASIMPQWLPDETLFSFASRYHVLTGNALSSSTCQQLFGNSRFGLQHDFPCRIDDFVCRTEKLLGTEIEIIRQHTILPFYLPFRSQSDENDAIASMRGVAIGSMKYRLGILTSRFRANHPLKACPECMAADINAQSIAYWHLSHQYPGVWSCSVHNVALLQSREKSTGVGRFLWHLPRFDVLVDSARAEIDRELLQIRSQLMGSLTRVVCEYATLPAGFHFDSTALLKTYFFALHERGFMTAKGRVNFTKIGLEFLNATEPLRSIRELSALPSNENEVSSQLRRLLRAPRSGTHPLRHLLFIQWLFDDWGAFMFAYKMRMLELEEGHVYSKMVVRKEEAEVKIDPRVNQLLLMIREGKYAISHAAKRIGIDTATAMVWAAKAGIATPRRPKVLKPEIREELIRDLKDGHDKQIVASKFGVSVQTITTTLRTEVGLHQEWLSIRLDNAQHNARATWDRQVMQNPETGVKAIRTLAPAAYAWLYRNDRAWLRDSIKKQLLVPRSNNVKLDWVQRDIVLAREVQRVALDIYEGKPTAAIFLWQIYQNLPELKAKLNVIDRLPLTRKAILNVTSRHKKIEDSEDLFKITGHFMT